MLDMSIGKLFDNVFIKYAERTAFTIGGKNYTYAEVASSVNRLANGFRSLGLEKGDRILMMTTNCVEYLFSEYAAAKIGLIKIPVNTMQVKSDIEYRLRDTQASAVILDDYFYDKYGLFFKEFDFIKHAILITENKDLLSEDIVEFRQLMEESEEKPPKDTCEPDDPMSIMYTGGTTGAPKGVVHTHRSYVSIIYSLMVEFDIFEDEVMLQTAPLPHASGFMIASCMLRGGRVIVQDGFDPETIFQTIQQERVTWTFMVPTMIYTFLDHPGRKNFDLSSLRSITYGAAPMSARRLEEAIGELGPIFLQGYSQMEVANQTCVMSKAQHVKAIKTGKKERLQSCGMPVLMSQIKIVDERGHDVPCGEVGELITRGPHMMKEYWQKEENTRETIVDGWLHTGDMARYDQDGYVYLVDRKKDMIISGGMNIYSAEVECELAQHPAVAEVIVVGIPDEKWGEKVLAIVVATEGETVGEAELIEFCKERMSAYKRPKSIEFVDSIPRTAYGKLDKKAVRETYWEGMARSI